jgi:hypothetical protein
MNTSNEIDFFRSYCAMRGEPTGLTSITARELAVALLAAFLTLAVTGFCPSLDGPELAGRRPADRHPDFLYDRLP